MSKGETKNNTECKDCQDWSIIDTDKVICKTGEEKGLRKCSSEELCPGKDNIY